MSEQIIKYNSRVIQKHDTSDNWSKATDFIPLSGEIIVYDDLRKIKIGNGTTKVNDLPFSITYAAGDGLKLSGTSFDTFDVLYGDGLTLDNNNKLKLDSSYTVTQERGGTEGRTGLMRPQDKWDLEYVKMVLSGVPTSTTQRNLPVGLYKFGTTSYGLVRDISPVTAEDLDGTEINTESSGASNTYNKIFLIGAEEQATTAKTFTNSKCYASGGHLYSNSTKVSVEGHTHSYAASSHNHAASNITSGTLDIARIPIGTSSTTAAAGNHTHSTISNALTIAARITATPNYPFQIKYNSSLIFKVRQDGTTYADKGYYSTGADYAELMEWVDQNSKAEDRRGYFVAIAENETIRIANSEDDVIGVISANPSIVANDAIFEWHGKYITDVYGNPIMEEIEHPEVTDEEGNVIPAHKTLEPKLNPNYDPTREYIPRSERPEWAAVGMLGQLIVRDDGTCKSGQYCKCSDAGIATLAEGRNGWKVLKRLDKNHIKILFK